MINWIIFITASMILIGIGVWSQHKIKSDTNQAEGFLLGAKQIGPFVGAMTLMATGYSGWGFIGSAGTTYAYGTIEIFANFFFAPAITFGTLFCANFMRKRGEEFGTTTIPEYIAAVHRGDEKTKRIVHFVGGFATFIFLSVFIIGQIRAVGLVASQWLGISVELSAIILMIVIVIFTVQGGLLAVALTDTLMAIGMLVASVIVYVTITSDISITELLTRVGEVKPNFTNPETSAPYGSGKYSALLMFVYAFLFTTTLPYMSVRFLSFKQDIKIHTMALIMAPVGIILSVVPFVGLYMFYKNPNLANPDSAMPMFLNTYLHPAVGGMITLFILFAMLSTISSVIQALSAALSHDMYVSITKKSDVNSSFINRISVIFIGVLGIALTFMFKGGFLNQIAIIGTGGLISMFLGPIMVRFFIEANIKTCLVSMLVGLVTNGLFTLGLSLGWVEAPILAGLCGGAVYAVMGFVTNGMKFKAS